MLWSIFLKNIYKQKKKTKPGPVQLVVTMTTQEDGVLSPAGRHAALVLGSKVRQWPLALGSFSMAKSWPPLWPLNLWWTTTCWGVRLCSDAPTRTTYRDGSSLPNLQRRDNEVTELRASGAQEGTYGSEQGLPADTGCWCQHPAGTDQGPAAQGAAHHFLSLKPHRHLPRPRRPERTYRQEFETIKK